VLEGGALKRLSWPMLDGTAPTDAAVLLEDVASVTVEFRDDAGIWRDDWTATDADALPRAIALTINLARKPEQRMLFLVGPQIRILPPSIETGVAE
jgi:general secretion pathway protein J